MLFSSLTTSILPAPSLVVALTTSTAFSAPSASATVTSPSRYYLKTCVVGGGHSEKEGLYVSRYHMGGRTNDVTLEGIASASIGIVNGTYQQFDYDTTFPWGLLMGGGENNAGFFFNWSGLQSTEADRGFNGWLACDWWHGVPQLFWKYYFYNYTIPSSCVEVDLHPVAVS